MYAPAQPRGRSAAASRPRSRGAARVRRRRRRRRRLAARAPQREAERIERARRTALLGRVVLGGLQLEQLGELGQQRRAGVGVARGAPATASTCSPRKQAPRPRKVGGSARSASASTEPTKKASASQPSRSLPDDGRHAAARHRAAAAPRRRSGAGERERHDEAARGGVARGGEGGGAE